MRSIIRGALLGAIFMVLLIGVLVVPAKGQTMAPLRGRCECVYWDAYVWGMKSEWTDNPSGFYERAWSFSRNNRTGATQNVYGPWRVNSFIYSDAPSPAGMVLVKGGYQKKESAGGKVTTIQTYPTNKG